ncbi:NnrU family protein [Qipengyuania sp. DGS5-3]|uniref:NnrU family protein n=1 Tax=Qipengyuania sp. DGS5-3 TaxID=3349632 RepID=UPI0036D31EEC
MDPALTSLVAASLAFVGLHFAMSHPLRAPMVRVMGPQIFEVVYSVIVIATMVWMYFAFKAVEAPSVPFWPGFDDVSWAIGSALTLAGTVLFVGAITPKNASMAVPGAEKHAAAAPSGMMRVTRHPMMWGFALWALAHIIAAPTDRTLIVMNAVVILALVGAKFMDAKKRHTMGEVWDGYVAQTRFVPSIPGLFRAGWKPWLIGTALWLALTWVHQPAGGGAAGVWRWV